MQFTSVMRCVVLFLLPISAVAATKDQLGQLQMRWGRFAVYWNSINETIKITDSSQMGKIIWAGLPFPDLVHTATADNDINFARGCFVFKEKNRKTCGNARFTGAHTDLDKITFKGQMVGCDDSFSLTFSPSEHEDQLKFDLHLDNPSTELNRLQLKFSSLGERDFYGFGHQYAQVNMRGRKIPIWAMEQGIGRGQQPISDILRLPGVGGGCQGEWFSTYTAVPFLLSPKGQGFLSTNTDYLEFDLSRRNELALEAWGNKLEGRIFSSPNPAKTLKSLSQFSGSMGDLPSWSQKGVILRASGGSTKVRALMDQLTASHVQLAALWIEDWVGERETAFGTRMWWNWDVDRQLYPDWEQLIQDIRARDVRVLIYFNPFLSDTSEKVGPHRNLYAEAKSKGYLIRTNKNEVYKVGNGGFTAGIFDLTNAEGREFLKSLMKEQIRLGVSGWMADFGEAMPIDAINSQGLDSFRYHNIFPSDWAKLNREAIEESGLAKDILYFNRSGNLNSPGQTKAFWIGDQNTTWDAYDGIKTIIPALLSGGLSGYAVDHIDGGGYLSLNFPFVNFKRDKELFLRWLEVAMLNPIFRIHNTNVPEKNWQVDSDEPTLRAFARLSKIFAALAPYRNRVLEDTRRLGLPAIRHMLLDDPSDMGLRNLQQQFMLGSDLIVAPVLDPGVQTVELRLSRGRWKNLWTGEVYGHENKSVVIKVAAPLGYPGLFTRLGSIGEDLIQSSFREWGLAMDHQFTEYRINKIITKSINRKLNL